MGLPVFNIYNSEKSAYNDAMWSESSDFLSMGLIRGLVHG